MNSDALNSIDYYEENPVPMKIGDRINNEMRDHKRMGTLTRSQIRKCMINGRQLECFRSIDDNRDVTSNENKRIMAKTKFVDAKREIMEIFHKANQIPKSGKLEINHDLQLQKNDVEFNKLFDHMKI